MPTVALAARGPTLKALDRTLSCRYLHDLQQQPGSCILSGPCMPAHTGYVSNGYPITTMNSINFRSVHVEYGKERYIQ